MQAGPLGGEYDAIVVGAGLGGLAAAATLARAGQRVLVVERQDGAGGYAHAFRRGPYTFDPAIHFTVEAAPGRFLDGLLRYLGVRDRCDLVRVDHFYKTVFPEFSLHVPFGNEAVIAAHTVRFPQAAAEIRAFFTMRARFFDEATNVAMQLSLRHLDAAVERFPTFFKYRNATVGEVLDEYFTDERLKAVVGSMWPYLGVPPSLASFYSFAQFMSVLIDGGSYYCRGSFQALADAFVAALEARGGELVVSMEVGRILVEGGRVGGVRLADGREARAPVVISNADARQTFERLVGAEHLPAPLVRRLARMRPSLSAFVLYAATSLDARRLDAAHEVFLYRHWDHEATYRDILAGRPGGMWANVPTLADPSLAPAGEHLVILTSLAPYDPGEPWETAKGRYTEGMLAAFEPVFPGLRERLTFLEAATPRTLERFSLNHRGATYGWALTPNQTGSKRLAHDTPVAGLYLAGHWTHEGAGSFRVILSGVQTARLILERQGRGDAVPTFRPSNIPAVA